MFFIFINIKIFKISHLKFSICFFVFIELTHLSFMKIKCIENFIRTNLKHFHVYEEKKNIF